MPDYRVAVETLLNHLQDAHGQLCRREGRTLRNCNCWIANSYRNGNNILQSPAALAEAEEGRLRG